MKSEKKPEPAPVSKPPGVSALKTETKPSSLQNIPPISQNKSQQQVTFKTGSQLPSVSDSTGVGKENKGSNKYADINKQFEELDLGDNEFDDYGEDDDNDGFDANELLNFDDYKNKRKTQTNNPAPVV